MKNRMLAIVGVIVVLFVALFFVVQYKNKSAVEKAGNPYEKDQLHQATIDQLDDPNYQNQITPDKLAAELEENEDVTVYFYDPKCKYCREATPVLVAVTEDLDVDLKKMNLLEFETEWNKYNIEGTPTVVHFENGEEKARIEGAKPEEEFEEFFEQNVLN